MPKLPHQLYQKISTEMSQIDQSLLSQFFLGMVTWIAPPPSDLLYVQNILSISCFKVDDNIDFQSFIV